MKHDPVVIILVAMVVTIMVVFGFHMVHRAPGQAALAGANLTGQPAPEFTLQSLDGKTVRLADFRGKAVLLNFWATWCEPCKIEMPWFVELQKQYGTAANSSWTLANSAWTPSNLELISLKNGWSADTI